MTGPVSALRRFALATALTGVLASPAAAETVYVKAARLLDVESGKYVSDPLVAVTDGKVTAVESGKPAPVGARVIDLGEDTILPGLIDMHVHLDGRPEYSGYNSLQFTDSFWAVIAAVNAKKMLEHGFTSLRNVGDQNYDVYGVKQAIEEGWMEGPRITTANYALGATGGHCDDTGFPPSMEKKSPAVADSPDEFRQRVREMKKYGAGVIKICATGGVFSHGDTPGQQQMTFDELKAVADEAHMAGLKVAAHAHGAEGIKAAIRAGIDTIEHASLVDDEGIQLAKEHGTWFTMDIFNTEYTQSEGKKNGVLEENLQKDRDIAQIQRDNFRKAFKAGVKMLFGTDAGVMPQETSAGQFKYMVQYGMTPLDAIRAATMNAGEALGQKGEVGVLKPGAWADIVAVKGDPLSDVTVLEHVDKVLKGGEPVD
ncbi:MAG: amidohydrolase family protein [Novosphingobium sp.]|nr:amidohydrolase family protein [Novosphingobium sp.]MBO9603824.1 amidohydrolase family protein [Novosphingobium sp.]